MFIAALFIIAKTWPECPTTDGKRRCGIYIYTYIHKHTYTHTMEYYSAIKKNKIMPFAAMWMQLEIILHEVSQKEKDKYHRISLISGI